MLPRALALALLSLLAVTGCGPAGPAAPVGTFSLHGQSTINFTETRFVMERGLTREDAAELAARQVDGLSGEVEFTAEGAGRLRIDGPQGEIASLTGAWTQEGRRIHLTDSSDPTLRRTFDWIDGSRALHLETPLGSETAVLVFIVTGP